jgi:hypothetical protein
MRLATQGSARVAKKTFRFLAIKEYTARTPVKKGYTNLMKIILMN